MSRRIQTAGLETWEVYATSGRYGFSEPARVIFRCLSDRSRKALAVELDGDKSEAEGLVVASSDQDLRAMLERAEPID